MFTVKFPGKEVQFDSAVTAYDAARAAELISRDVLACRINGVVSDLTTPIDSDAEVELLTFDDKDGAHVLRHTASHVLAAAVKRLYPEVKLTIGPAIDNGFYYDFDSDVAFTPDVLEKLEAEMKKIVKENAKMERFTLPREEALELMKDEPYKVELINDLPEDAVISFYKMGDFTDLCAGPHLFSTGAIKAFKLTSCNSAYWRGDAKNKVLQRIYGTAFTTKEALKAYLDMIEEAKKRDHRKLGKELGLFAILDEGPGFPFFLPKGMVLRNTLIDYWREVHKRYGYVEISTPMMLNRQLWERSGHWDHYKENMYTTVIDGTDFAIKPMNCPGGMLVYKLQPHSYRDLPLRMGELGLVHRHELSGALHGLFRVRCFTQDDAHIFMTWDQMKDEIKNVVRLFDEVYSVFGLSYEIEVSTMPEDHMGDVKDWDFATETLKEAVTEMGKTYVINEGDGAFYGPKLDFHISDCLGRTWQCGTIQLDMQLPERFELEYTGADNEKHRPVMIHRVVLGSIERFIGVITEHFAGAFPLWLSPVQVEVLPVSNAFNDYGAEVAKKLDEAGIRVHLDDRNEKIGYKIREAQLQKTPYMLVVGEREKNDGTVSVRTRAGEDKGAVKVEEFVAQALEEIRTKAR
ncbi:MAG: threonine--tRNA ligase [Eubacteriales bacterium]|nr:threonine--tRNA ligase [Clostridia bacterium]MDY2845578.1 threonine--tRNA ligase [Eubacteriales bacterium]